MSRLDDLKRFYTALDLLEGRLGGRRRLSDCSGRRRWPGRGVYFFMEPGESRSNSGGGLRIVRVGTHALRAGSRATLWNRLQTHKGQARSGGGNHRSSIFRGIIGRCLRERDNLCCPSWKDGGKRSRPTRQLDRERETDLERKVSRVIGNMPFLWLGIGDAAAPQSDRGYVERNAIALLSNHGKEPRDPPSGSWLGRHSDREQVRDAGLYNSNHVKDPYDPEFLRVMSAWIQQAQNPMAPGRPNPYQTGRGVLPPVVAGRSAELGTAERRLAALAAGRTASEDLLYYGPRGNGKTTLLIEIRRRARELGLRTDDFPVSALTDPERLVRRLQERAGVLRSRIPGVQVAGVGATTDPAGPPREVGALFRAWLEADSRPLVVLLDEIHAIVPEVARSFLGAVQHAKGEEVPFLLVAAGTPDAPRRLREAGTCNERGFERIRVGRLRREDTRIALAEPARRNGRPMSAPAATLLADTSQHYPYFIQLLGNAAWECAEHSPGSGIGIGAANRGIAATRPRIEDFCGEWFDEAWDAGLDRALPPIAGLFAARSGGVGDAEVSDLLERLAAESSPPFDRVALRNLGVVWQSTPGVWEMGIPSFAAYVLRRTARRNRPAS